MKTDSHQSKQALHDAVTMHALFEKCAEKKPHHIAIVFEGRSLTYGELNQKANQLAHYLQNRGVQQNTLIAISMARSPELMIAILAVLKANCAYLPLDETHPAERLLYILNDAKAPVLLTQSTSSEKYSPYQGEKILLDSMWPTIDTHPSHNPSTISNSENLAYVIYTSGSTGKPNGVLIEHKSLVNYINWFGHYSQCRPQDRVDFSANFIFDMAVTTSIAALALSLQVVIYPDGIKKDIQQYLDYLNKNKINIIKLTPSYFKLMAQEIKNYVVDLPHLQSIILGGENLFTVDCRDWLATYHKHHLFNEYGPTEATVAITHYKITSKNVHQLLATVPIGKPGFNIECLLLGDNKLPVPHGEIGELYISGSCLARGYLNQTELTSKRFLQINASNQRWYQTGDLCRYLPDGNIEFIARADDQVKIRGYRIEQGEIAAALASYPLIKDVVVIARGNLPHEKQLVAYLILKDKALIPSKNDLRRYLQQQLVDYMIPSNFVILDAFPLTANGKLDKEALPSPTLSCDNFSSQSGSILEQKIIVIWQEEFHLKKINSNANFFELGGYSLIAARIISKIEKVFGKKIRLEDFYKADSIKQLAIIVESAESGIKNMTSISNDSTTSTNIALSDFQLMLWMSNTFEPKAKKLNIIAKRRLSGKLDLSALNFAFASLFKKHEILSYRIATFFPEQSLEKNIPFEIFEKNLSNYSAIEREAALSASLDALLNHYPWKKHQPMIIAKLFYLGDALSELQIGIPHIIFDNFSEKILFSYLSTAYKLYKTGDNAKKHTLPESIQYKDYVSYEHSRLNQNVEKAIHFWGEYLRHTRLLTLPSAEIIQDMKKNNIAYSTYLELADDTLENLQTICTDFHVTITDIICGAIAIALKKVAGHLNRDEIFINIVKSTRDNETFDKIIGCFIRLDPIKIDINTNLNLIELSKFIQQSRIEIEPYQTCSGIIKIASVDKSYRKKFIKNNFFKIASILYAAFFNKLKLNPKILAMCGRINFLRTKQNFLIDVNLLENFIFPETDKNLFGYKIVESKTHHYDLSNIDNILDICLFRNESIDQAYLVISGNLTASFRQQLGNEINNSLKTLILNVLS